MVVTSSISLAAPWQDLELVGQGKLSVLFWDIYNAQLFSADGQYQPGQYPLALKLTYLRDFKKKQLISETEKQWEKLGIANDGSRQAWIKELERLWPDVAKRDAITLFIDQDSNSYFYHNQTQLGKIQDSAFCEAFLAIWLSEGTSAPEVREQLIAGQPSDD